jgi:hypothetical protein
METLGKLLALGALCMMLTNCSMFGLTYQATITGTANGLSHSIVIPVTFRR